jgi:hypothetical protein
MSPVYLHLIIPLHRALSAGGSSCLQAASKLSTHTFGGDRADKEIESQQDSGSSMLQCVIESSLASDVAKLHLLLNYPVSSSDQGDFFGYIL